VIDDFTRTAQAVRVFSLEGKGADGVTICSRAITRCPTPIEIIPGVNAFAECRVQFDYPKSRVRIIE
jgi:hypothetical protein